MFLELSDSTSGEEVITAGSRQCWIKQIAGHHICPRWTFRGLVMRC